MSDLLNECVRREVERQRAFYGDPTDQDLAAYRSTIAPILADVMDILSADGRMTPPVEPGICGDESRPITYPSGDVRPGLICTLKAGHDGWHHAGSTDWTNGRYRVAAQHHADHDQANEEAS